MIVVVGKTSFIAREFLATQDRTIAAAIGHAELGKIKDIPNITCIVNFAFAPELYSGLYQPELDIDRKLGAFAATYRIHYVMISSRKVYDAEFQWGAREDALATGQDSYGKNKIRCEQELVQLLGSKLTILRPGNVFGFERQPGRTRFGAYMLNQLADKDEIKLTISPHVRRDIVPVDYFCEVLGQVVEKRPSGVVNVGAGQAVAVGQIARSILEGFGRGRLIAESTKIADEFQLNSGRLALELGLTCGVERVLKFSKSLGEQLKEEIERNVSRN
ncbi:WcaG Nucleoside-diphosphate-sugar epimerases [Oxalobacteraceae bacterium]